jgi:hypothetical protein
VSDIKDDIYISNTASITHRPDYYDVRAMSYIVVIAEIIRLAEQEQNKKIKVFLLRHALVKARHFLGLYQKKVQGRTELQQTFRRRIRLISLAKGISRLSDVFFLLKLFIVLTKRSKDSCAERRYG